MSAIITASPQEPGLGLDLDPEVAGKSLVRDCYLAIAATSILGTGTVMPRLNQP